MKSVVQTLISVVASFLITIAVYHRSTPQSPIYYLTVTLENPQASVAQVFYDTGKGWSEQESAVAAYQGYFPTRFLLPKISVHGIRFDPTTIPGNSMRIFDIRITDDRGVDHEVIPLSRLQPASGIDSFNLRDSSIELTSAPGNGDPQLSLNMPGSLDPQSFPQTYPHPLALWHIALIFVSFFVTIAGCCHLMTPAGISAYNWLRSQSSPLGTPNVRQVGFFKVAPVLSIGLTIVIVLNLFFALLFSLNYYFLMDDFWVLDIAKHNSLLNLFNEAHISFYRPLVFTLFKIQIHLFGWEAPTLFSIVSLLIHILNCSLLACLVWKLIADLRVSVFAGVLYFLNPWAGESTLWFCLQSDLAAVTGSLIVLFFGLDLESDGKSSRLRLLWVPIGLFSASLFAYLGKESALTLPAVYGLILAIRYPVRAIFRNSRFYANMGAVCLSLMLYMYLRSRFLSAFGGAYGNYFELLRNLNLVELLHPFVTPAIAQDNAFYTALTFLNIMLMASALIMAAWGRFRAFILLALAFVFSLLPILDFTIPFNSSAGTRWHYLPSFIMVLLLAYGMHAALMHARSTYLQKGIIPALTICYLLILSVFMQSQRNNWSKACDISRSCMEQFEQVRGQSTHYYLPNIPHQFREGSVIIAAHVFHHRFHDHGNYKVRGAWNLLEDRPGKPVVYHRMFDRYSDYTEPHSDELVFYFKY